MLVSTITCDNCRPVRHLIVEWDEQMYFVLEMYLFLTFSSFIALTGFHFLVFTQPNTPVAQ